MNVLPFFQTENEAILKAQNFELIMLSMGILIPYCHMFHSLLHNPLSMHHTMPMDSLDLCKENVINLPLRNTKPVTQPLSHLLDLDLCNKNLGIFIPCKLEWELNLLHMKGNQHKPPKSNPSHTIKIQHHKLVLPVVKVSR